MDGQPPFPLSASHWGAFRAEVTGDRITRVLPFEHDPQPSRMNEAWQDMLHSPLRVAQPVVRRGWLEGDHGAERGCDSYVEVSWDRALDLVAGEIGRIREAHGNSALFAGSYGWSSAGRVNHARTLLRRFFATLGGFTDQKNNYSFGAAMAFLPHVLGRRGVGPALTALSSAEAIREHCDVFLAFGGLPAKNWEVQSGGFGAHGHAGFMAALRPGTRVINISPYQKDIDAPYRAEWIPVRPGTDTALMMALTHEIVAAGHADRAFLANYTSGADRYLAYLAGDADGTPKNADWAAGITGIAAADIRTLAQNLRGRRVMVAANWSLQRAEHGEQPYWAAIGLACVLGQVGLPGGGFGFGYGSSNAMANPAYQTPLTGLPVPDNATGLAIPCARVADMLLTPGGRYRYDGDEHVYPDIRLVYWAGGNPFHHHQDLNRLREAFRRPETVIVNENFWTATARHADIVLPATVAPEREDIGGASCDPYLLAMQKLVPAHAGARDDFAIFAALAARLGAEEAFTGGRSQAEWLRWSWDQTCARLRDRGMTPPSYETFRKDGFCRLPDPAQAHVTFAAFRADPETAPLDTPSGRIELWSAAVAAEPGLQGHPAWMPAEEFLGAEKRFYPLHLLSPQPARKLHGQMDFSAYSREGKVQDREHLRLNPEDAAERGISDGDPVRIYNDRGACLAVARFDRGVMPGVVLLPTGATYDPDGTTDRNSNPNVLTQDIGTSGLTQGCAAQSCLVAMERLDTPLPPLRVTRPPEILPAQG